MNLQERKNHLLHGTSIIKSYYGNLYLAIGEHCVLHIWIGREKAIVHGGGKLIIYIRLKNTRFSIPFNADALQYMDKPHKKIIELSSGGFKRPIDQLDNVLELTKYFKETYSL